MEKFSVTGMSCAACVARVEKAVKKVPGVSSCAVSLLTNSMGVEGSAPAEEIIKAVQDAGYGASVSRSSKASEKSKSTQESSFENSETQLLKRRLISSLIFLALLMYWSMGHMMLGFPLPAWFKNNHVAMALVQMILAAVIMLINKKFFVSGIKGLLRGGPNMDTLVALGSGISFVYSTVMVFNMTDALVKGDRGRIEFSMGHLYFESAAMILTLITVGKLLESISKGRTTDALKSLIKLAPKTARILRDGKEVEIPVEELSAGDIFIVKPGDSIPVDGLVAEGSSAVNESALTGESIPVDKKTGDKVSAATINTSGSLTCRATRVGEDTTLSQIIKMVSDAAATKAPIAKIADKVSGIFVPLVILISAAVFAVWLLLGADFAFALNHAISVLVVSCPCALGLATPVAIMVGNGVGAKNGILFKTSASLESCGRTQIAALDKTGTITKGQPEVTDILPQNGISAEELVRAAASLESKSEHPLAKALLKYAESEKIPLENVTDFTALPGNGLQAKIGGITVTGGSISYFEGLFGLSDSVKNQAESLALEGKTPLFFAKNGNLLGIITVADTLKEDSPDAIRELKEMKIRVVMLTGDNEKTAREIGGLAGVDSVIAGVLPDGKEEVVRNLQKEGKTSMVGDGINDAPALTRADTGIAIGAGADVAIDAADVVLVKNSLADFAAAVRLSRATLKNIRENLFWAFFYNIILIPVAAGAYYNFGLDMNPMFGAAAMSLSSFCVVTNALRLNFVKIKKLKTKKSGDSAKNIDSRPQGKVESKENFMADSMSKVLKVEGMMCQHCEAHVKEALEKIPGVESAVASHEKGQVDLQLSKEVPLDEFKKAVEGAGYKFIG